MTAMIALSSKESILKALVPAEEFDAMKDVPSVYLSALYSDLFDPVFHLNSFCQNIEEAFKGIKKELPARSHHAFLSDVASGVCKAISEVNYPNAYALAELLSANKSYSNTDPNFYMAGDWASRNSNGPGITQLSVETRRINRYKLLENRILNDVDIAKFLSNEIAYMYNDMGAIFFHINLIKDDISLDLSYSNALKAYTRFKNKIAAARNNDSLV